MGHGYSVTVVNKLDVGVSSPLRGSFFEFIRPACKEGVRFHNFDRGKVPVLVFHAIMDFFILFDM